MAIVSGKSGPVLPKNRDIALAETALAQLSNFLSQDGKKEVQFVLRHSKGKKSIEFLLTPSVVELIFRTVLHVAQGDAVTIVPFHAELTTQEAANCLNVSRPYLIQLLEKGLIPFRRVGRHRRVLFEDVLKYKRKSKEKSRKIREELSKEAQSLDLGY